MKQNLDWKKSLVAVIISSIAITGGWQINNTANASTNKPETQQKLDLNITGKSTDLKVAVAPNKSMCRIVKSASGVNIQASPDDKSAVVKKLANKDQVTIENRGKNGWVPISAPAKGYVPAKVLIMCPK